MRNVDDCQRPSFPIMPGAKLNDILIKNPQMVLSTTIVKCFQEALLKPISTIISKMKIVPVITPLSKGELKIPLG